MKKNLVISLMAAGALSLSVLGCGKNAAQEDSSIFENAEDAEDAEDAVTNENSATNEGEADEINASVPINIVNHKVTCEANGKVLAEGSYPEIIISDEIATITVPNKSWSSYTEDGRGMDDGEHVTISKISEEKTDWLDTEVWADKNGFEVASFPYSDDKYLYEVYNLLEYEYMNSGLRIYDAATNLLLYDLDLYTLCNGPDEETGRYSATTQYIRWAKIYDGTLYVSVGHNGYASVESKSSYIVAIAPDTGYVLWRSEPLVSNANNFQIVKDTIICGYGFTAEDDFIYLLDRFTGQRMDKIKVNSGPDQFEVLGDTLYVATYNTAYEFKIE